MHAKGRHHVRASHQAHQGPAWPDPIGLAILSFVSQNPDAAMHMGVRELAASPFTGPTAVVRFYKKLGFESFGEVKLAMAQEPKNDDGSRFDRDFPQISKATNAQLQATFKDVLLYKTSVATLVLFQPRPLDESQCATLDKLSCDRDHFFYGC